MKRTWLFLVVLVAGILLSQLALAYNAYPIWFHVHSNHSLENGCSDGIYDIPELIRIAMRISDFQNPNVYSGIAMTDHSNLILEKDSCKKNYFDYVNQFNKDNYFVSIPGQESTVAMDPKKSEGGNAKNCHMNIIGSLSNHTIYDLKYPSKDVEEAIEIPRKDPNSFIVLNHIRDCKLWESKVSLFDAIELFNDYDGGPDIEANYKYQRNVYLNALKQGWQGIVVGGSDFHLPIQWQFGWIATYVFADHLNQTEIIEGLRKGRTIATRDTKVLSFSPSPQKDFYEVNNDININGSFEFSYSAVSFPKVLVYRDGDIYSVLDMKKEKAPYGKKDFSFSYSDSLLFSEERHCYVFEIDMYLVTSPVCFLNTGGDVLKGDDKKEEEANSGADLPAKPRGTLRITNASFTSDHKINIESENESLLDSMPIYEICSLENFIFSSDQKGHACVNPFFSIVKTSQGSVTARGVGSCSPGPIQIFNSDNSCIEDMKKSFIREIGPNDYRAIQLSPMSSETVLLTGDSSVNENSQFAMCDSNQPITLDSDNRVTSCTEKYQIVGLQKLEGKLLYRLVYANFLDGELLFMNGRNYFILIKK